MLLTKNKISQISSMVQISRKSPEKSGCGLFMSVNGPATDNKNNGRDFAGRGKPQGEQTVPSNDMPAKSDRNEKENSYQSKHQGKGPNPGYTGPVSPGAPRGGLGRGGRSTYRGKSNRGGGGDRPPFVPAFSGPGDDKEPINQFNEVPLLYPKGDKMKGDIVPSPALQPASRAFTRDAYTSGQTFLPFIGRALIYYPHGVNDSQIRQDFVDNFIGEVKAWFRRNRPNTSAARIAALVPTTQRLFEINTDLYYIAASSEYVLGLAKEGLFPIHVSEYIQDNLISNPTTKFTSFPKRAKSALAGSHMPPGMYEDIERMYKIKLAGSLPINSNSTLITFNKVFNHIVDGTAPNTRTCHSVSYPFSMDYKYMDDITSALILEQKDPKFDDIKDLLTSVFSEWEIKNPPKWNVDITIADADYENLWFNAVPINVLDDPNESPFQYRSGESISMLTEGHMSFDAFRNMACTASKTDSNINTRFTPGLVAPCLTNPTKTYGDCPPEATTIVGDYVGYSAMRLSPIVGREFTPLVTVGDQVYSLSRWFRLSKDNILSDRTKDVPKEEASLEEGVTETTSKFTFPLSGRLKICGLTAYVENYTINHRIETVREETISNWSTEYVRIFFRTISMRRSNTNRVQTFSGDQLITNGDGE